jgi:pyruvate,water dikinase
MTIIQGGVTASPGAATGPVVIVRSEKDALSFPKGGVLVAQSASPLWAVLLNRAVAVVAETGSVAGHLASVARECGVPALFDVKENMVKLKEGQLVTVDADAGRIYEGSEDAIRRSFIPPISHIQGSPVYESLKRASEFIIPLNLLDPDGPSFTIENCKSNHDITRFCHEKAIKEIFSFGSSRKFSEQLSKRLFIDVPMQYWVIDLDDGYGEGAAADGNFIRLENIVSVPMLALWRGITAVDWEGPPPIDTRGFASAIFEATTDTSLLSSGPNAEDERNYFLITKRFLSFHSRIGYHFANVESLVGDQNVRDYLIFVFKGGAANIERRVRRTQLLSDLLEHIGFHTRVVQDSLNARLESSSKLSVETGLEIVGHLIIHSRQLDMIMTSDAAVEVHRKKLLADVDGFLERAR